MNCLGAQPARHAREARRQNGAERKHHHDLGAQDGRDSAAGAADLEQGLQLATPQTKADRNMTIQDGTWK